ncbi:hypothetical protein PC129_g2700 [Phytophthora cactorum]|uniref:Jacalin-type lectin domain-containing protein n=1 Tax=Phytophthora cactorum TaxID=29920 RepID=A0A329RN63_9STRA|nr:hypothetical protein Pcac1_g19461 [Phytophthora cactorum]KAG2843939.1 hypothetical protein PC112_g2403 [Phytophthora cactorum]KAG2844581.1 hypothetical protein PC111_g1924 [Phytophthora cactorum]KAG2869583.1 hypothetical protein PC113_g19 [Phytophthora cactorum]KAG2935832.1 hypothetical protein PC114_g437 [Phytophthora cactorum]
MPLNERLMAVLQALTYLIIATGTTSADTSANELVTFDENIQLSQVFGGSQAYAFSDISSITLGQTLSSITVRGEARIDAVSTHVATPAEATWDHGGNGGKEYTLTLDPGE